MRLSRSVGATLLCIVALGHVLGAQAPPPSTGRVLARYDFTRSAQGWRISGDTDPMPPLYGSTGCHEGGCIEGVDQALGETWYFNAPADAVAQLRGAVDGTLSYWLKQSGDVPSLNDDDVLIIGPAGRLSYRFPTSPGTAWTPMSVRIADAAGWVFNWNRPATRENMLAVLATATQLLIRGEYVTGDDHASLDTVTLTGPPDAVR